MNGYATTEKATQWGLAYPDESVEIYDEDYDAALADLKYSRLMEQRGDAAYAGCRLVKRTVVTQRTAWEPSDASAEAHAHG